MSLEMHSRIERYYLQFFMFKDAYVTKKYYDFKLK